MRHTFLDMLSFARPHSGHSVKAFATRFLLSLPGAFEDKHGNIHVCTDPASRVLWSAHTDTVHKHDGRQTVRLHDDGRIALSRKSSHRSACLGADDTTGCYLMREMILASVPGYYIFHHGEERGGIGSRAIADHYGAWLAERFDYAIAFDRAGYQDVITHQTGSRCCSDAFASALADHLNAMDSSFDYAPCSFGVYTDTAEYAETIPECTNISVGYFHQHSSMEWQDWIFLEQLRDALIEFDVSKLSVSRDPSMLDPDDMWHYHGKYSEWENVKDGYIVDSEGIFECEDCGRLTDNDCRICDGCIESSGYDVQSSRFDRPVYLCDEYAKALEQLERDHKSRLAGRSMTIRNGGKA